MTQNYPRHYAGELEQMQSLPLDAKIAMTKRRIREWYEAFNGDVYERNAPADLQLLHEADG